MVLLLLYLNRSAIEENVFNNCLPHSNLIVPLQKC